MSILPTAAVQMTPRGVRVLKFNVPGRNTLKLSLSLVLAANELDMLMTPFDLKRLESYANNSLDYHVVLDLLPTLASLYFDRRLGPEVRLSAVQSAILLGLGLQRKSVEEIEACPLLSILISMLTVMVIIRLETRRKKLVYQLTRRSPCL